MADLIRQSERAVAWLLEVEADPQRQAALAELAAETDRAMAAFFAQRQDTEFPPVSEEFP
jgi:hypothetical protein